MRVDDTVLDRQEMKYEFMNQDPLKEFIFKSLYKENLEEEQLNASSKSIETFLNLSKGNEKDLRNTKVKVQKAEKSSDGLILKELPKHLKYEFLGKEKTKPVIIAADLTSKKQKEVVKTLRKYKEAITWSIRDLKGISPSIFMHKILMEENAKLSIEHERKLNPVIKEVVRKEVVKWLNAGFIYVISDSPWVIPVHVVPKRVVLQLLEMKKMN